MKKNNKFIKLKNKKINKKKYLILVFSSIKTSETKFIKQKEKNKIKILTINYPKALNK